MVFEYPKMIHFWLISSNILSFILRNYAIVDGTKDPKMLHKRNVAIPHSIWSIQEHEMETCFSHMLPIEPHQPKSSTLHFKKTSWNEPYVDISIHYFSYAIMLSIISNHSLMLNSMLVKIFFKFYICMKRDNM